MYEQINRLTEYITAIIGIEEWWYRRLEEDGGINTALGLYGSKVESEKIIEDTKLFLVQAWEKMHTK